jgi:uncharacterized membrane protein HdeD (DUF308 family)
MRDVTLLMVWLIGLFVLIGGVMAAVARFVHKDSVEYDKRFTWATYSLWNGSSRNKDPKDGGK